MVWWFVIPAIIGIGSLVALGAFLSEDQQKRLNGKKIGILGAAASGKSRFFEFIATEKFTHDPTHYEQTRSRASIQSKYNVEKKISNITVEFDLANSIDVGGQAISYGDWRMVANDVDFLLYLIDSYRFLYTPNYHEIIIRDIAAIEEIVRDKDFERLMIVINKMDKLSSDYDWEELFTKHPVIQESRLKLGGTSKCKLVMGSLKNEKSAETLLKNVLETL